MCARESTCAYVHLSACEDHYADGFVNAGERAHESKCENDWAKWPKKTNVI